MTATLHVCITCKGTDPGAEDRPGAVLARALEAVPVDGVRVRPVECLSACTRGCAIALSAAGKWSYVYGDLTAADVPAIVEGAARYAASADGVVPWRERPTVFRKQSLARIPPQETKT